MNLRTLGAWMTAGAAFWVSLGSLDVTMDGPRMVRVAMLPTPGQFLACMALAVLLGAVLRVRIPASGEAAAGSPGDLTRRSGSGDAFLPLYALGVLTLPYFPLLPDWLPVLRVFAGPGRLLVWLIVAAQVTWSVLGAGRGRRVVARVRAWSPVRCYLVTFVVSAALFGAAALALPPSGLIPGGDEPHYLVITQSLLKDGDLRIDNNRLQPNDAGPDDAAVPARAMTAGRDGGAYPVHPIGLPLLAMPAFAAGGHAGVVLLMVCFAAAASALAWRWVRRVTGSVSAATYSWSATALSVPYLTNSGTIAPGVPAALAVMIAATVALRDAGLRDKDDAATSAPARPWRSLLLGLATAALPWLHVTYALLSAVLLAIGIWRLWRDRPSAPWSRERLITVAAAPYVCSVVAWCVFHYLVWSSSWPAASFGGASGSQASLWFLVRGVPGLLVDQEHGVLAYAPALALGLAGLWSMWRSGGRPRGLAAELGLLLAALLGTAGAFRAWWGGTVLPGTMLVPVLLLTTLPVAWEFRAAADRPERRAAYRLLLLIGLAMSLSVVVVPGGAALVLGRNGVSGLLEWLSPDWHLWAYAPDFIMQPTWLALLQAMIWALAILASAWAVGLLASRGTEARGSSRTGRGLAFFRANAGAFLGVTIVTVVMPVALGPYLKTNPSPEDRSRIGLLESFDPSARPIGVRFDPVSLVDAAALPRSFSLSARSGSRTPRPPTSGLLGAGFALPAGRYEVELTPLPAAAPDAPLSGTLVLRAGRSGGSLTAWNVAAGPGERWHASFDLPVDMNAVGFGATGGVEARVGELRVRPIRVIPFLDRIEAHGVLAAAKFGQLVFLFHDDSSYPETGGVWIRGSSRAILSVVSSTGRLTTKVRLRLHSPVANAVRFETPGLNWTTDLEAGVAAEIDIQPAADDGTLRMSISPASGFRPSEIEPGSQDRRFLGCWVEIAG